MNKKKDTSFALTKTLSSISVVIFLAGIMMHCTGKMESTDAPVYQKSAQVIYNGSVYYNQAGCASCHGSSYKGDGPDKADLNVPDLTAALPASKTPLDYFKSITVSKNHNFQSYTDRGRWALAYFSYSLADGIKTDKETQNPQHIRNQALAQAQQETELVYSKQRRWFMGMQPPSQLKAARPPALDQMAVNLAKEKPMPAVSSETKSYLDPNHPGYKLYQQNCASCHGNYAEGSNTGYKVGLTSMCKERGRLCAAYISIDQLNATNVSNPHNDQGLNLPGFAAFSETEWDQLSDFIQSLK